MEEKYIDFLRQIINYEELVKNQKEYSHVQIRESTKQYLHHLIECTQKQINVEKTLDDWEKVKPYVLQKENYEKRLHAQVKTRPLYISMLYLMNHHFLELFPIYEDMINERLYNPNATYDLEGKRIFWENLPNPFDLNSESFIQLNKKVMENSALDFHKGGTLYGRINFYLDQIGDPCLYSNQVYEEKKYYIELLTSAIKANLNLLDTHRETWGYSHKQDAYLKRILTLNPREVQREWQDFRNYLFSMECIHRQCELSWNQEQLDFEAVDRYIEQIPIDEHYEEKRQHLQRLKR